MAQCIILIGNGPPSNQTGRMRHQRIRIRHCRRRALRIRRAGCPWTRPRARAEGHPGHCRRRLICMRGCPGLARPAPRGRCRPASKRACAAHVRVVLKSRMLKSPSESALPPTALFTWPFGVLAAPTPGHAGSDQGRAMAAGNAEIMICKKCFPVGQR